MPRMGTGASPSTPDPARRTEPVPVPDLGEPGLQLRQVLLVLLELGERELLRPALLFELGAQVGAPVEDLAVLVVAGGVERLLERGASPTASPRKRWAVLRALRPHGDPLFRRRLEALFPATRGRDETTKEGDRGPRGPGTSSGAR
jgi:hypothetical protein